MECNLFRFQLKSLKSISLIQLSAALWNSPTIEEEIEGFVLILNIHPKEISSVICRPRWWKITEKILSQVKFFNLPHHLSFELSQFIIFMGQKFFYWIKKLLKRVQMKDLIFDVKYFKTIYWTVDGLIDESKIFQHWKKEYPKFPGFPNHTRNKLALFTLACTFWDEEYLEESLTSIGKISSSLWEKNINSVEDAMLILITCLETKDWKETISVPDKVSFDLSNSNYIVTKFEPGKLVKKFSFFIRSLGLNKEGIKYLCGKLNDEKKKSLLTRVREDSMAFLGARFTNDENYHASARTVLHTLNFLPEEHLKPSLLQNLSKLKEIILFFLTVWPYQVFCKSLIDYVWKDLLLTDQLEILKNTLKCLNSFPAEYADSYKTFQLQVLKNVLTRIPEDEKLGYFLHSRNKRICRLFEQSDYLTINTIINDNYLKKYRFQILDISFHLTEYFRWYHGRLEQVKEYVKKFNFSREEEHFFDNSLLTNLIRYKLFLVVDEILMWRYNSNIEKIKERKNDLVEKAFLNLFIYGSYDDTDRYCVWHCDGSVKEVENFKRTVFTTDCLCEMFWNIWARTECRFSESAEIKCEKFLTYFLKTREEVLGFKKKKIIEDENCVKTLCKVLLEMQNQKPQPKNKTADQIESSYWPYLSKVFKFCQVEDTKVQEIKRKIKGNFDSWYRLYSTDMSKFLVLNSLVKWVCDSDKEKKVIIKKYLEPDATAKYIYYIICKSENKVNVYSDAGEKVFLRDWVSVYGDVAEIKVRVKCIEDIRENDIIKIMEMLNRFPQNLG